jgi:hemolysin III
VPPALPRCRPFTTPYDRAELLVDGLMHAAGLAFAFFGLVFLTADAQGLPPVRTASVWIYGVGLVSMFATSAAYNFWPGSSAKLILRRFDQSVIFLFIAATYTPFIALAHAEPDAALLAAVWAVAWIGVVLKLACPGRFERLGITLCLTLGWSGLLIYDSVFASFSLPTVMLIVSGGILYSVGVVFHLWDQLRFQNAIWHAFVLCAAALQFCAIFDLVSVAAAQSR